MARRMSAAEARANFGDVLGIVHYTKEPVIIERKGKPFAVVVSPEEYEAMIKERKAAYDIVDRVRERNADRDSSEVETDVAAAVEAVRQEMHEERKEAAKRRR